MVDYGRHTVWDNPTEHAQADQMVGKYQSSQTSAKGMEQMDKAGALQWQDSAAYNMTKLSVEREGLLNEQLKADMANKAQLAKMAGQYLGSWNEMLGASNNMLNAAAQSITGLMKESASGSASAWARIDAAIDDIGKNVTEYQQKYGGLETEAINTAISELGAQRELTAQMKDLTKVDPEGAATRAKADVASESSAARSKMADELVALGVDPTSGAGRSMMRQSMDTEALGKVMAGNKARLDEKGRGVANTATALQAINPAETAGIATNIAQGKRELMGDKNKLLIAGTDAQNRELQSKGELASALARVAASTSANAAQVGDFGAALLGAAS